MKPLGRVSNLEKQNEERRQRAVADQRSEGNIYIPPINLNYT